MTTHARWTAAAAVIIVAAVALRIVTLTAKSLSFDETYSIFIASQSLGRLLALTAANDAHPPLYYALLHWWIGLVGDSELAARALSVPISAAVVALTWFFGRRLLGPAPALIAAGLVAVAPSQVADGQEARMYALLALAALASWWALWAALAGRRRRAWIVYALAVAAMLYSHYYAVFVVVSHAGYLLWQRAREAEWRRWIVAGSGVLLLYLPWLPAIPSQFATGRAWPDFRPPLGPGLYLDTLASMTVGQVFFEPVGDGMLPRAVTWPLALVVAAVGVAGYRALSRDEAARALLVGSALFPVTLAFAISFVVPIFAPRYLGFAQPGLALLLGAGIAAIGAHQPFPGAPAVASGSRRPRWTRPVIVLGLAALALPNGASLVQYYQRPRRGAFDWRQVSQTLAAQARPDDVIVFLPGFARIPVNYYFRGPQMRLALTPRGTDVEGTGGVRMDGVVEVVARHPRAWIVTVEPVPLSVDVLVEVLSQKAFVVTQRHEITVVRLFLLERTR